MTDRGRNTYHLTPESQQKGKIMTDPLTASAIEAEREAQQRRVERDIAAHQAAERRARGTAITGRQMSRSTPSPARDTTPAPTSTGARIAAAVLARQAEEEKVLDPFRDQSSPARSNGPAGSPPSATELELTRRHRESALQALEERTAQ